MEDRIRTGETVNLKHREEGKATANPWVVCAVTEGSLFEQGGRVWIGLELKGDRKQVKWVLLEGDENYIVERNVRQK